ncbi:hypothetical protein [Streptococcus sp. S784/96/1]|uniref:hypothetical protein n=1 Tax=Streptococcus sp. S784/96/1 TaxID=2653499 RepID=UPI00138A6114|nr:hypothetical protein [Streptococcus sp. S784/96/1]
MNKLSPKPTPTKKYTWWDLEQYLNMSFSTQHVDPKASIDYRNYEMSKEEIILEGTKAGYKVTDNGNGYLTFE